MILVSMPHRQVDSYLRKKKKNRIIRGFVAFACASAFKSHTGDASTIRL